MFLMKLRMDHKWLNQTFFIDDTNIFDQENVSEKDRTIFIADAKKYLEERDAKMEISNDKQKIKKRRNTC